MKSGPRGWVGETNRTVDRALRVLSLVAESDDRLRFADIEANTGMAKATLHEVIGSLLSAGWLTRDEEAGWLDVGPSAFEVGIRFPVHRTLREAAAPILSALLDEFNETLHFGMLSGGDVVYVDRAVSRHPVRYAASIGQRLPAYATGLGKAMLATLDPAGLEELYPDGLTALTTHTITSMDKLIEQLKVSRDRGYFLEEQESTIEVRCVGVLVPTASRPLALSMTAPITRASSEDLERVAPRLQAAAQQIAEAITTMDWFAGVVPTAQDEL